MNANLRGKPAREDARSAVTVSVSQGRGGQFGGEPCPQRRGQQPQGRCREVVERAGRCEQSQDPVGGLGGNAMVSGGLDDLRAVSASVEERDHPGHASHAGQRHCPSRVDTDLQCVAVSPHWQQPGLQRWSHDSQGDRRYRQSGHCGCTWPGQGPAPWPGACGTAGVPGHRSDMASSRSLRYGPFASLPQKRRAAWSPGTPAWRS